MVLLLTACSQQQASVMDDETDPKVAFAKCLTSKGIKLYTLPTCSHCKTQKQKFGPALDYVDNVDCSKDKEACTEKGIQGVPTWIDGDGEKHAGDQDLEKIAEWSGCNL